MLWCIHKVKEFESNSQHADEYGVYMCCCDVSTKLKNLKATHNDGEVIYYPDKAVMYPQS